VIRATARKGKTGSLGAACPALGGGKGEKKEEKEQL